MNHIQYSNILFDNHMSESYIYSFPCDLCNIWLVSLKLYEVFYDIYDLKFLWPCLITQKMYLTKRPFYDLLQIFLTTIFQTYLKIHVTILISSLNWSTILLYILDVQKRFMSSTTQLIYSFYRFHLFIKFPGNIVIFVWKAFVPTQFWMKDK